MQINHRDKQHGMATYTDLKLNILFKTFLEHDDLSVLWEMHTAVKLVSQNGVKAMKNELQKIHHISLPQSPKQLRVSVKNEAGYKPTIQC